MKQTFSFAIMLVLGIAFFAISPAQAVQTTNSHGLDMGCYRGCMRDLLFDEGTEAEHDAECKARCATAIKKPPTGVFNKR